MTTVEDVTTYTPVEHIYHAESELVDIVVGGVVVATLGRYQLNGMFDAVLNAVIATVNRMNTRATAKEQAMEPNETASSPLVGRRVGYVAGYGDIRHDIIDVMIGDGDYPVVMLREHGLSKMDPDMERVASWHFVMPRDEA